MVGGAVAAFNGRNHNWVMTIEQLRMLHQARPFQPFEVHMGDGRSVPVPHPEVLAIIPPGRTIVVGLADGTAEIIDMNLVTSLEHQTNGEPRRGRSRPR
jgi:hypothetical protein